MKSPFPPELDEVNATTNGDPTDRGTTPPADPDRFADDDVAAGSPATVTSADTVVVDSEFTDRSGDWV